MRKWISMLFLAITAAASQQSPPEPVFRAGTRLVEVEIVVRAQPFREPGVAGVIKQVLDQTGPPFGPPGALARGLTRDDFTLLDQGKPQPIAVFHAGSSSDHKAIALPPGAVSNRLNNRGEPLNGATAVLVDLLNTPFIYSDYARVGLKELLRTLGQTDTRVALYSLGRNLHSLHDFDDDPKKLMEIAAALDRPHGRLPPDLAHVLRDYGDIMALEGGEEQAADLHGRITVRALRTIIQHLSGAPGRKNLVWLAEISRLPPGVVELIQRANIVLYPVMVRCPPPGLAPCGFAMLESEYASRDLGTATGGRGFYDARDLTFALHAAEEDAGSSYVLGYYPPEDALDGKYHNITVKVRNKDLVLHYRSGYLATKVALPAPAPTPDALFAGRADSAGIGLSAQFTPVAQRQGFYDLSVMVDLHDIHLDRKDGHFTGALDLSIPNPSARGTVGPATVNTGAVAIDLTDEQFAEALEHGLPVSVTGAESDKGVIRVVVRDRTTGIAGSLRVPVH
jgi:VWFA-related protein